MRKLKLYIAASLNGKIARKDGEVDWLDAIPNPGRTDHGYADFYQTIDTTIQGYKTYEQLLSWDIEFPYADKINYVVTRQQNVMPNQHVTFIRDNHIPFIQQLKEKPGKDIWLIGGGQVNSLLFNAGLIDEISVFVMPIIIPEGIDLFSIAPDQKLLTLVESKNYSTGAVELKYKVG